MNAESDLLCVLAINKKVFTKVPPSGERRGQRPERHEICKAPEGEQRLFFSRLANYMTFSVACPENT